MPPEHRDPAYLWDIVEAGRDIAGFVQGTTIEQFAADRRTCYAVAHAIQIIGEAARGLSAEFKAAHSDIPWTSIVGQRNVLVHAYASVDYKRIWQVATVDVPVLINTLAPLLPTPPSDVTE